MAFADVLKNVGIPAVFVLVVVAIVLGIGAQTLEKVRDTQVTDDGSATVVNESHTGSNYTLQHTFGVGNDSAIVYNDSSAHEKLAAGDHYNLTGRGVLSIDVAAAGLVNLAAGSIDTNVSYNHSVSIQSLSFNATSKGLEGVDSFADFQGTLALVVVMVVILGLLLGGFMAYTVSKNR